MGTVTCGQIFKGASRSFTYRHERLWYRDEFPYHQHPEYEITVVLSGGGRRVTNDFTEPFREGEIVVLPPYFPHGWVYDKALCAPDGMIENGSLQFGEEFLVQLSQLSPEFQPVVGFYKELRQAIGITGETAARVRKLLGGPRTQFRPRTVRDVAAIAFPDRSGRHYRPIGPGKFRGARIHKNKQRLQAVYKYIVENYHRKITLEEIASYASMNKTAFCLFFKKATNESFVAYLNVFRLQMACTMLTRSSKNISEICYASGFYGHSLFQPGIQAALRRFTDAVPGFDAECTSGGGAGHLTRQAPPHNDYGRELPGRSSSYVSKSRQIVCRSPLCPDNLYTQLIEQVKRQEDDHQRERVAPSG